MRLGLFVILILVLCFVTPSFAQSVCAPAVVSSIDINEETSGFSIDVKYPVLCSSAATRVIRDHVMRSVGDFKADFPEHDLSDYRHKHEMLTDYSVWRTGKGRYASIKLQVMVYTGGAHPNHWPVTWVFDMTNGSVLRLADIFTDKMKALVAIAPMVRDVLRESLGQMALSSMLDSGTIPKPKNYADFIINDEGIAFFFAPYQVAPYAAGQQVVTIPWGQVQELLTPAMKEVME